MTVWTTAASFDSPTPRAPCRAGWQPKPLALLVLLLSPLLVFNHELLWYHFTPGVCGYREALIIPPSENSVPCWKQESWSLQRGKCGVPVGLAKAWAPTISPSLPDWTTSQYRHLSKYKYTREMAQYVSCLPAESANSAPAWSLCFI